ncbi:Hypothetical protein, putative [Bodo saltans]|uniref:SH3 domain-containing protein n=1 Tax=Bodo saltans TaxID=75058 RepID=A0A0S4JH24_BODSA|nr:Hypothetical protein, putative [Bodo saltans]|eukprot:CUG89656.1 Hypothetical protein, putative [Bodo saltans]
MPANDASAPPPAQKQWRTEQCVAICDYQASSSNEISFQKGDVISVTGKRGDSSGFWEGITTGVNIDILTGKKNKHLSTEKEGKSSKKNNADAALSTKGLFPTCMVSSNMRAYNEPRFCDKILVLYDYAPKTNDEADLCKGDIWTVTRPSTSPGWWYGVKEGTGQRVGDSAMSGPTGSNKHKSYSSSPSKSSSSSGEKLIPINFVTSKLVVSGLPCQGNATNELPMSTGDVLQMIRRWNDGWWEGMLRGKRGIFPSNLVHPNVSTIAPPLFCQRCKNILQYQGPVTAGSTGKCSECAEHERVVDCMLQSLVIQKHSGSGESSSTTTMNLFSLVDEELLYGKKFLQDVKSGGTSVSGGGSNLDTTTVRRFHTATPPIV